MKKREIKQKINNILKSEGVTKRQLRELLTDIDAIKELPDWIPINESTRDGIPRNRSVLAGRFVKRCNHNYNNLIRSSMYSDTFNGFGDFNTEEWPATHYMDLVSTLMLDKEKR